MKYSTRDAEVRATISKDEAIRLIEQIYHASYDPDNLDFDVYDQLLACKSVAESTPVKHYYKETNTTNKSVSGIERDIDSNKPIVIFELTTDKITIITKLRALTYRTNPHKIAELLEEFFIGCGTLQGWWLHIAQQWSPKAIISALNQMIKVHQNCFVTIRNSAKYFSNQIKYHPKRKVFRRINDTHKQQSV
jgi:hypothetical protein